MKKLELHKPNQLIEIEGQPLTTQGILAYNFLLHKFQQEKSDKIIINLAEIFESLDISDKYEDLSIYLDNLLNIKIRSFDKKGKLWGGFNLLSEFKKVDNGVFIQIPNTIFKALCGNEEEQSLYYTTLKLLEQKSFKCVYTSIFYEILKKYEKINIPNFLLDDLKKITGTINKYSEYKDFKRYVLNKGLEELNQLDSVYKYSFEEKRLGRKVNEIKFVRTEKKTKDVLPKSQISENLLKVIVKARKNRFIDSSYSQKAMDKIISMYDEKDIIKALKELYKYNSEINNFQRILISKIDDIKSSKMPLKAFEIKNEENITSNTSNEFKEHFNDFEKSLIEISKEDYELLYEMYLKENDAPNFKSVRIGFDRMNKTKYKIIE